MKNLPIDRWIIGFGGFLGGTSLSTMFLMGLLVLMLFFDAGIFHSFIFFFFLLIRFFFFYNKFDRKIFKNVAVVSRIQKQFCQVILIISFFFFHEMVKRNQRNQRNQRKMMKEKMIYFFFCWTIFLAFSFLALPYQMKSPQRNLF